MRLPSPDAQSADQRHHLYGLFDDYVHHLDYRSESPDLAITEAAVGAGITSLLFFLTLKKIHAIDARNEVRRAHEQAQKEKNGGADDGNA